MSYSSKQYRQDLTFASLMAVGFTLIAAVPLGLMGIVNVVKLVRTGTADVPWSTYLVYRRQST
jgi:hypothetical protein